jgi:putative SOS response-associated peptidase YedK
MCGRYTFQHTEALRQLIEQLTGQAYEDMVARYNVAPTQAMPVVTKRPKPVATRMRWGPLYRLGNSVPSLMINARSETAHQKVFKHAVQHRRCLVPADGFFEWDRRQKTRVPYLFRVRGEAPFWIAGIYEEKSPEADEAFLVLTTAPNELVLPFHDRMPVILDAPAAARWLEPGPMSPADLSSICVPYNAAAMDARAVNPVVNNARNDGPECVAAAPPNNDPQAGFDF